MDFHVEIASLDDLPALAQMNGQLITDEGHRNTMDGDQLTQRMREFLAGEYRALIARHAGAPAGYALARPEASYVYLRQLFVARPFRRQGLGRLLVSSLAAHFPGWHPRLRIDVLSQNEDAIRFWRRLGFADYCITMER